MVRSPRTTCGMATPPEKSSTPSPQHVYCGHTIIRKNNEGVRCCLSVCLPACMSVCLSIWLSTLFLEFSASIVLRTKNKGQGRTRGLLGCVYSGFTPNYADRFVERFTITPCSQKLVRSPRTTTYGQASREDLDPRSPTRVLRAHDYETKIMKTRFSFDRST